MSTPKSMRRYDANGQLAGSASRTSSGNGSAVKIGVSDGLAVARVSAVAGTSPTLDLEIEESQDGSTGWTRAARFNEQITGTGLYEVPVQLTKPYARGKWTLGGTSPDFTFELFLSPG